MTEVDKTDTQLDYIPIIAESELSVGERIFVEINGTPIMIINQNGNFLAISDFCSHDHGPLGDGEVIGDVIICPRHGARFNIKTGKVLSLPAVVDIPVYPTRVKAKTIEVGISKEKNK